MKSLRSICVPVLVALAFSSTAVAEKALPRPNVELSTKQLSALNAKFANKLSPNTLEAVSGEPDRVNVIVLLNEPDVVSALAADFSATDVLETYMQAADQDIESVISSVSGGDVSVKHRYRTINGFAAQTTLAGLEQISKNPLVKIINLDTPKKKMRVEGKSLMKVPAVHSRGNRGSNVTVAVIDDGVDYTHPELGGTALGSFPNSVVIGGFDFAVGITDPSPFPMDEENSHGTAVAGIIAGRGDARGGSGVAPAAKIVGLRVAGSDGITTSRVIAALDWIVQNRTSVNPAIKVVNLSLGGGRFQGACNGTPDLAAEEAAIGRVANAGVNIVASAGNDGWIGMAAPACFNQVISVGAVYDAAFGRSPADPSNAYVTEGGQGQCFDASTAADQPTCYSNLDDNMTLRGPAENAFSPKAGGGYIEDFGGTSAAGPYVAGTIALLLERFPTMTRSQVANALRNSGKPITELGRIIPRVDIDATLVTLGDGNTGGGSCTPSASKLCLLANRFEISITAIDQTGRSGAGQAVSLVGNDKFGFFSIPALTNDSSNPEVLVKMLDARAIGSGFWVFYGPMTTFTVNITVRDMTTGRVKVYTKPAGVLIGEADTAGFPPN